VSVSLRDLADNLRQAAHTEKAFMSSEFKPSIIVKVDAMTDEFSSPEGRQKLIESYINPQTPGAPWLIPAEQFDVQQVKPLTLSDLAIADTVTINKKSVAALLGVPAFVVGAGDYNRDEWNAFIQGTIMPICKSIAMEMTKKLILKPEWYLTFNVWSLIDYDLQTVSSVLLAGADRGYICGDEWRDRMHMSPAGLKEYKILENYIPYDMSGNQKKLVQNGE
jgi:HK97 family phage portal protein